MADSCCIAELKETIEKMNVELGQSHTKISELDAKVREQEGGISAAQKEIAKLQEENARLAKDLKESEEKCRTVKEKWEFSEQKLAQFLQKSDTSVEESLAQVQHCQGNVESRIKKFEQLLREKYTKLIRIDETNDGALGINSLCDEIILEVFGYLTQNQLGQIARVCRRWKVLTKSPVLWEKVNVKFSPSHISQNIVTKLFINQLPSSTTSIRLDFMLFVNWFDSLDFDELCMNFVCTLYLKEIVLIHCNLSNSLSSVIDLCDQFLQNVKSLIFHHCQLNCHFYPDEYFCVSKIEILELHDCCSYSYNESLFSKMPHLKQLRLSETNARLSWFENDTSFLKQLHVLNLRHTNIDPRAFSAIQNHGHNLKKLYLCLCFLRDHSLFFTDAAFPHLRTICLSGSYVTCEGVVSLIQSCPSLENVYVDEDVAESFAAHPFVVNRHMSGIVKAIDWNHNHNLNDLHNFCTCVTLF